MPRQERADIRGVAGPEEGSDRAVPPVEHDTEHHLVQLRPIVLGEAALAQRGAPPWPSKYNEVVLKNATDSSPNSSWRWR